MGNDHFYTIQEDGELCGRWGYIIERVPGYVFATQKDQLIPIYRFCHPQTGDHFYTRDINGEVSRQMGYVKEYDAVWWMHGTKQPGTTELYRWWGHNDHFYTTDPKGEMAPLSGYTYDNVLGYLYTEEQPGTVPLRRYYNGAPSVPPHIWSRYLQDAQNGTAESAVVPAGIIHEDPLKPVRNDSHAGRSFFQLYSNGRVLKYAVKVCGPQAQPGTGYPLYICFHGGGTNNYPVANGNDVDWWNVFDTFYGTPVAAQSPCVLVACRGISAGRNSDTYDLHSQPESYTLIQRMIMNLILPNPTEAKGYTIGAATFIDPNRVYLLGFSAGGNGVFQLSTKISDRCAAVVAGGGHPEGAVFDNLAKVPIRIQVGGNDIVWNGPTIHFPRPPPNLEADSRLNALQATYGSSLYTHRVDIIENGNHNTWAQPDQVDKDQTVYKNPNPYALNGTWTPPPAPATQETEKRNINPEKWVATYTRNPAPSTVIWNLASRPPSYGPAGPDPAPSGKDTPYQPQNQFHWLYIRDPAHREFTGKEVIRAAYGITPTHNWIKTNNISPYLAFLLNTTMVNFAQELRVFNWYGALLGTVWLGTPSEAIMTETLKVKGDPLMVFSKMVFIEAKRDSADRMWELKFNVADTMHPG